MGNSKCGKLFSGNVLFSLATLASAMSESGEKCYACYRIKHKTNHTWMTCKQLERMQNLTYFTLISTNTDSKQERFDFALRTYGFNWQVSRYESCRTQQM